MHGGNLRFDLGVEEQSHVFIELHPRYKEDDFSFVLSISKKQELLNGLTLSSCSPHHDVELGTMCAKGGVAYSFGGN